MIPLCFGLYDLADNLDLILQIFVIGLVFFVGTLFIAFDLRHKHGALGKLYCFLTILGGGFGYINALGWAFSNKIGRGYPLWVMLITSIPAWGVGFYLHLLVDRIEKRKKNIKYQSKKISEKIKDAIIEEATEFSDVSFANAFDKDADLLKLVKQEDYDSALEYVDKNIKIATDFHDDSKLAFFERCRRLIVNKMEFLNNTTSFFSESEKLFEHQFDDDDDESKTDPRTRKFFSKKKEIKPPENDE